MSGVSIDLTGETFGNLKVIRRVKNNHNRQPRWLCECKCGNTYIAEGRYLKSGKTKSCGCIPRGAKSATAMTSREEWDSSESRMRLQHDGADPYQSLANAIVCVAADDYLSHSHGTASTRHRCGKLDSGWTQHSADRVSRVHHACVRYGYFDGAALRPRC